ncbi:MAG: hypothetical protein Q4P72_05005, partial [Eubacteriales bacterium]|nr:hypothetical protein [Eubacteriales bacterium]
MSKYTRIACTIAGRYPDGEKGGDGFYLDGRLKQGHISEIDITLDREDQGAFYAVYASAEGGRELGSEPVKRNVLDRIMNDMKNEPNRNIDEEINELADAAVTVAGRLTLDDDDSKQPYFSGLMVKDAEIAAVTLGRACAFLYRQDILYPLTEDDIALEPVDTDGNPVPNFNIYKAGSAATIRYSNIAQLQGDDCFILCNKEVLQCVNQRELLQILFEVEEASEAAERVVQLCAERLPERPCQFMIGFVEDILADSKTLRSMGRRQDAQVKDSTGTVPVLSSITGRQNFSAANLPEESNFEQRFEEDLEEGRSGHKGLLITLLILLVLIAAYVVGDYYYNITDRVKNQLFPTTTTT